LRLFNPERTREGVHEVQPEGGAGLDLSGAKGAGDREERERGRRILISWIH